MAKRKRQPAASGVPEWVVTFGDLMSLLLCFFVLLQMFSEIKKDHEYQRVVTAIKEAFGYSGGVGVLPVKDPPLKSMIETLETIGRQQDQQKSRVSHNDDPGLDGPNMRVTKIQEGVVFTLGGPATFDAGSATLKPQAIAEVERLASMLAGRNNKIRIVGHSSPKYLDPQGPWKNLDELGFARAMSVRQVLVDRGLRDDVFQIVSAGSRELVNPRALDDASAAENRRVEVILTENLVEELKRDALSTDPALARGG